MGQQVAISGCWGGPIRCIYQDSPRKLWDSPWCTLIPKSRNTEKRDLAEFNQPKNSPRFLSLFDVLRLVPALLWAASEANHLLIG